MVLLCLVPVCHFAVEKRVLTEPQEPFPSAHGPFFGGETIHFKALSAMKIQEALDGFSCLDVLCVDP